MEIIVLSIIGAIVNRFRGGGLLNIKYRTLPFLAVFLTCALYVNLQTHPENMQEAIIATVLATIAMWAGEAAGWGRYIGALGGWERKPLMEFAPVDFVIRPIRPWLVRPQFVSTQQIIQLRLWGFCGLTLRGAYWGALLGVVMLNPCMVVAGATMGVCYAVCIWFAKKLTNDKGKGWEYAEFVFGGVLWASMGL